MQHVQPRPGLTGQEDGLARGGITGFRAADKAVAQDGIVAVRAVRRSQFRDVFIDNPLVLAVRGNQHVRAFEDAPQGVVVVHQHIPRARAQEQFDAADALLVQLREEFEVVVCRSEVARMIGQALLPEQRLLVLQGFQRRGLRHGVGHVHYGRDAASYGCPALAQDVGLVGQSRFAEVDMVVYRSRQQQTAGGIDDFVARAQQGTSVGQNLLDASVLQHQRALFACVLVDDGGVVDKCSFHILGFYYIR